MRAAALSLVALTAVLAGVFPSGAASLHMFSYDPADAATRTAAGPLTFTFTKGVFKTTVLNVRSTEAPATADLRRADGRAFGHGGVDRVIGRAATDRELYQIKSSDQGDAMVSAFCPGAKRAWMALGPLKLNRDLEVLVLGAPAEGGDIVLCRSLRFAFHGEWAFPAGRPIDPKDVAPSTRYPGAR